MLARRTPRADFCSATDRAVEGNQCKNHPEPSPTACACRKDRARSVCVCVCPWPRSSNQLLLCPHSGTRHMGCWDLLGVVVRLLLRTQSSTSSHFVTTVFQTVLQEKFSLD